MEESRVRDVNAGSSIVAVFGHVTNLDSDCKSSDMLVLGTCRWEYHVRFPTTVASHMHDCRLCLPAAGAREEAVNVMSLVLTNCLYNQHVSTLHPKPYVLHAHPDPSCLGVGLGVRLREALNPLPP